METFSTEPDIGAVASKVLDWEGERVDFVDCRRDLVRHGLQAARG